MEMENHNIHSAWQNEVMNRIKDKLWDIRNTLRVCTSSPSIKEMLKFETAWSDIEGPCMINMFSNL